MLEHPKVENKNASIILSKRNYSQNAATKESSLEVVPEAWPRATTTTRGRGGILEEAHHAALLTVPQPLTFMESPPAGAINRSSTTAEVEQHDLVQGYVVHDCIFFRAGACIGIVHPEVW